jgi:hypothetical protein
MPFLSDPKITASVKRLTPEPSDHICSHVLSWNNESKRGLELPLYHQVPSNFKRERRISAVKSARPHANLRKIDDASKMTRGCGSGEKRQTIDYIQIQCREKGEQMNDSQLKAL